MNRRLDPIADEPLLRECFAWDREAPSWYQDMDQVFGPGNINDFLAMTKEPLNILIGVFNSEFVGLIVIACAAQDIFEAHLWAKRGTEIGVLVEGTEKTIQDFFSMGMKEAFCLVAERNKPIQTLCASLGFRYEGVCMYRGLYKGRVIKWLRYSIREEARQLEQAA